MEVIDVLRGASVRIFKSVAGMAGTKGAGGDFGTGAGGDISRNIDITAERAVLDYLDEVGFGCVVLGEECGRVTVGSNPSGYLIMDAIDGSANAVRGMPFFCSSLAFAPEYSLGSVTDGVVMDLSGGGTYAATRGEGASFDGKPIRSSGADSAYRIVGVNLSGASPDLVTRMHRILKGNHVRHMGANALEMAQLAHGRMDAFVDLRCKIRIQDIAAGYLIVKESGGLLVDETLGPLDADLGYDTRVSFIAAASRSVLNEVALQIGIVPGHDTAGA